MHVVIKNTSSIDEYKKEKDTLERLAKSYSTRHKASDEALGEPVKVWRGFDGVYVEYDDDRCFRYDSNGDWH